MKSERPKKTTTTTGAAQPPAPAASVKTPKTQPATRKPALKIPPLLLEGDDSPVPPMSGPGHRYALRPVSTAAAAATPAKFGELPEAYGTQKLLLTARDPHWLYACCDLTREQLERYHQLSVGGPLVLRTYREALGGQPFSETHVPPESRAWFVYVGLGGATFLGELGYYAPGGQWVRIATSAPTRTPPDKMSEDLAVLFETMPPDVPFQKLALLVKAALRENIPLLEALQQLRATGVPGAPARSDRDEQRWTPQQEAELAAIISMADVRREWISSLAIPEVLRRQLQEMGWPAGVLWEQLQWGAADFGQPAMGGGPVSGIAEIPGISGMAGITGMFGISSLQAQAEVQRNFWFNVNVELIVYGATEPGATVTIGGRPIKLRPDGSFSCRFALPEGSYQLPTVATSADGAESRAATLTFGRSTDYRGEVGKHPQEEKLKPPPPEHVS